MYTLILMLTLWLPGRPGLLHGGTFDPVPAPIHVIGKPVPLSIR